MSNLLNKLFIDSFSYFEKKELTIPEALKVTDILLLNINVNTSKPDEFISYLDNFIELNKVLSNHFSNLTDKELELLDNSRYELVKSLNEQKKADALTKIKERRLELYNKHHPELITKVKEYKSELTNSKAA
jgi:hypothetical protein